MYLFYLPWESHCISLPMVSSTLLSRVIMVCIVENEIVIVMFHMNKKEMVLRYEIGNTKQSPLYLSFAILLFLFGSVSVQCTAVAITRACHHSQSAAS